MVQNPYEAADREMLGEIIREAESYLTAQLQAGIAADTRAISFVSLMAGATAAAAAGGFALLNQSVPSDFGKPALLLACGFMVSMLLAVLSARPVKFWYVGNRPSEWIEDIRSKMTTQQALAQQAHHYDEMIAENMLALRANGRLMLGAIGLAWGSLLVAGIWAAALTS